MAKIKIVSKSEKGEAITEGNGYVVSNVMIKGKEIMRATVTGKEMLDGLHIKISYAFKGEKYHAIKEFII
jgi:hypothetical protein